MPNAQTNWHATTLFLVAIQIHPTLNQQHKQAYTLETHDNPPAFSSGSCFDSRIIISIVAVFADASRAGYQIDILLLLGKEMTTAAQEE